jgi:hypothetical protein
MLPKWGWAKSGYIQDMKVTKEKLHVLGYITGIYLKIHDLEFLEFGEFELVFP